MFRYLKKSICYVCEQEKVINYINKCLIPINEADLKSENLSDIIKFRFLPSITTCECINDSNIMCKSNTFEIDSYPKFLPFIIYINYNEYFNYLAELIKIFNNNIYISKNMYLIRGIVYMLSSNHYNCYMLNNKINFLKNR